jgi:type VI secretion system protein ImpL
MDNVNKPAAISVAATVTVCIAVTTLLVLLGGVAWWLWATERSTEWETLRPLIVSGFIVWGIALSMLVLGFMAFRLLIKDKVSPSSSRKRRPAKVTGQEAAYRLLRAYLRSRYSLFWRYKVRLLLITGDDAAIEQLVPGLQKNQWLEGSRTVLIYGGSLTTEPDKEKYTALRKLRRGRPLDGIVRVVPQSLNLTPQISDTDLRGLEKISELLRYSAPVWLWQLCNSTWSQAKRTEQAVGASFPLRARPDDITRQLELMLPALRTQGVSQVAENNGHDFLLRLGQHLKNGGITLWTQQLVPWLAASQQRVPLRGLMFSLPENNPVDTSEGAAANPEKYVPESQRHALTLTATWQGIEDDCTRVRGRRVGMAWEREYCCRSRLTACR